MMPVSVRLNHAIADGYLVARVFKLLDAAAIGFYRRIGYAVCEKYPPYGDEKDAVCMEKSLLCDTERRKETRPDGIGEMLITPVDSHKRT